MMNNQLPTVLCLLPSVLRIFTNVESALQIRRTRRIQTQFPKEQNEYKLLFKKGL
jgi:hypothetical protein